MAAPLSLLPSGGALFSDPAERARREALKRALERELGPRRLRYCREYMVHGGEVGMALAAAGYSPGNSTVPSHPKVLAYIAHLQAELREKYLTTSERVLAEYAKLAFLDPREFFDSEGNLKPIHELPADAAAAIAGMEVALKKDENGEVKTALAKLKFVDKKGALDSISRTLGSFRDKVEVSGEISIADAIRQARDGGNPSPASE